jgi:hypothetical protein
VHRSVVLIQKDIYWDSELRMRRCNVSIGISLSSALSVRVTVSVCRSAYEIATHHDLVLTGAGFHNAADIGHPRGWGFMYIRSAKIGSLIQYAV